MAGLADLLGSANDAATQKHVDNARNAGGDPFTQWSIAKVQRQEPEGYNDVPLRNAEHYLWTYYNPIDTALAAPYLVSKQFESDPGGNPQRTHINPDSWGELKWGTKGGLDRLLDLLGGIKR